MDGAEAWTSLISYLGNMQVSGSRVRAWISSTRTVTLTTSTGLRERSGSGNAAAGVISGDFILRLPLDDFWPSVHLAPYILGGGGAVFTGAGNNTINTRFAGVNERFDNASSNVSNNRGLGHVGGGVEYRFTPHIGIFGEADYNWVSGGNHNFNSGVKRSSDLNMTAVVKLFVNEHGAQG